MQMQMSPSASVTQGQMLWLVMSALVFATVAGALCLCGA
jgi:hypothetical protein